MIVVVAIVVLLLLAVGAIVAMGRRRSSVGELDRDAVRKDRSAPAPTPRPTTGTDVAELDEEARQRAADSRQSLEPAGSRAPVEYVPVDEEEIGLSRRQFFNRGILTGLGIFTAGFGVAMLGFLWPQKAGGFGAQVDIGSTTDAADAFSKKIPFYNAGAKTYLQPYPEEDLPKAKKVYIESIFKGMEQGYVALYQTLRAPGLPGPVVRDVAVVRVPVPRLEVQPGRREARRPRAPRPRPLPVRRSRAARSPSTPARSCRARPSAPTPPAKRPKGRPVCKGAARMSTVLSVADDTSTMRSPRP